MRLLRASYTARGATIRRRAIWVLLVAAGLTVSRLARLAGVSRPTVYRYLRIWIATREPEALRSGGSGRRLARSRVDQELADQVQGGASSQGGPPIGEKKRPGPDRPGRPRDRNAPGSSRY